MDPHGNQDAPQEGVTQDGYLFKIRRTRNAIRYMVCKNNRTLGCTASAKITPTGEFAVMYAHHNHPREEGNIQAAEFFRRQLREACVREGGILKNIYEHAAIRNPDGAVTVSFSSIRSSMLRWRQETTPNVPANLEEFE